MSRSASRLRGLEEIAWVDFDEARACPLPTVTRMMPKEAVCGWTIPRVRALHAVPPGGYAAGSSLGGRTEQYVVAGPPD